MVKAWTMALAVLAIGCSPVAAQTAGTQGTSPPAAEAQSPQKSASRPAAKQPRVQRQAARGSAAKGPAVTAPQPMASAALASMNYAQVQPKEVLAALNPADRRYATAECREIRERAAAYQDGTAPAVAMAVGATVVLALVGAPVAIVPNVGRLQQQRMVLNLTIVKHCDSNAERIFAAQDARRQADEISAQNQKTEAVP